MRLIRRDGKKGAGVGVGGLGGEGVWRWRVAGDYIPIAALSPAE